MATLPVLIMSGPPGAGKTTISADLAGRFERAVHLPTDVFFTAIRSGFIEPWRPESAAQNETVVRAAAGAAAPYALAGYATIVDGVVLPWALEIYATELANRGIDTRCVVLLPDAEEVVRRGLSRDEQHGLDEGVYREMHRQLTSAYADDGAGASVIRTRDAPRAVAALVLAAWLDTA